MGSFLLSVVHSQKPTKSIFAIHFSNDAPLQKGNKRLLPKTGSVLDAVYNDERYSNQGTIHQQFYSPQKKNEGGELINQLAALILFLKILGLRF